MARYECDYELISQAAIDRPIISVIVPVYNMSSKGYLQTCLESILSQKVPLELIIVDDCSTDDSLAICRHYAATHEGVTLLHMMENMKQGTARNRGLEHARGQWISFIDSDDYICQDYYDHLLEYVKQGGIDSDVIAGDYQLVDVHGKAIGKQITPISFHAGGILDEDSRRSLIQQHPAVWNGLYRREYIMKREAFAEGIQYEDTPWVIKTCLTCRSIAHAPDAIYYYRSHPASTIGSAAKSSQVLSDRVKAGEILFEALSDSSYEGYKDEIGRYYIEFALFGTLRVLARQKKDIRPFAPRDISKKMLCRLKRVRFGDSPSCLPINKRMELALALYQPELYCLAYKLYYLVKQTAKRTHR